MSFDIEILKKYINKKPFKDINLNINSKFEQKLNPYLILDRKNTILLDIKIAQ